MADKSKTNKKDHDKSKEETSSFFQRKRVDMLLGELLNKFPLPIPPQHQQQIGQNQAMANTSNPSQNALAKTESSQDAGSAHIPVDSSIGGMDIKQELVDSSPPPSSIGNGAQQQQDINDMLGGSIKLEANHMKPPPEKKMKMM